jgi:glycogen debranching enzyme
MLTKFGQNNQYLCASFDPTNKNYNPIKYWRGPVWINLNWILYKGLKQYGFNETAQRIKKDSIALIKKFGFNEYFDARKEKSKMGYGGNNFSWTAALIIDLINE